MTLQKNGLSKEGATFLSFGGDSEWQRKRQAIQHNSDGTALKDGGITVSESKSRQQAPGTVNEGVARAGSGIAGHRNSNQSCSESGMLQVSLEPTPSNISRVNNAFSMSSQPLPLEIGRMDVISCTQQPKKMLENTGCFCSFSDEGCGDLNCFKGKEDQCGPASLTMQFCADNVSKIEQNSRLETTEQPFFQLGNERPTSQEPSQATCMEDSIPITPVASDLLTDDLTVARHVSCKTDSVNCEGSQPAKVRSISVDAVDNGQAAYRRNLLEAGSLNGDSHTESGFKREMIKYHLKNPSGWGKTMGVVTSTKNVSESSESLSVKKGMSSFSCSKRLERKVGESLCEKQMTSQNAHKISSMSGKLKLSTLFPSSCISPDICKTEASILCTATEKSLNCERSSDNHQYVSEEVNMSLPAKEINKTKSICSGRLAMARVQCQAKAITEADDHGCEVSKSDDSRMAFPVKFNSSKTQYQETEKPSNMDYLENKLATCFDKHSSRRSKKRGRNLKHGNSDIMEKKQVNCLKTYYSSRPKRFESNLESVQSGDVFNCRTSGFQAEISPFGLLMQKKALADPHCSSADKETASRKTFKMKFPALRMKRKAPEEPLEKVSRQELQAKHRKIGSWSQSAIDSRSDNDTLLSFRDSLVLQRQVDPLRRKVKKDLRKGSKPMEKMEKKSSLGSMLAEKSNQHLVMRSKRRISEQKAMSRRTYTMLKDKSLKLLTRDIAKQALLDAGFKIDLRPRRSRDYQDSVYVSPDGQAYWSIPKAWEALKKLQAHKAVGEDETCFHEDSSCVCGMYEKAKVQENNKIFAKNDSNALKEVFARFGNDERLRTALTKRGISCKFNLEVAENGTSQVQDGTRQANVTNADLTDILLGEMGLLRRVTMKSSKMPKHNKCTDSASPTLRDVNISNERSHLKWKQGNKQIEEKLLDRRSFSEKLQIVSSSKERKEKQQLINVSSNQRIIEPKLMSVKNKNNKGLTFVKNKNKKGEKPKQRSGLRLEVRQSNLIGSEEPGCHSSRTVFAWMIDRGAVLEREKISTAKKNDIQTIKEGVVTREGILCSCCKNIFTAHGFQIHAGSDSDDWHQSLVFASGKCLLDRQLKAWDAELHLRKVHNYMGISDDDINDDSCLLCGDGGNLICCDGCPSTFHASCLEIDNIPDGDWYCPKCSCAVCCRCHHEEGKEDSTIIWCSQCEHRYHDICLGGCPSLTGTDVFCQDSCKQIFSSLQDLVGISHTLPGGFSWSLLRCMEEEKAKSSPKIMQIDCHSKLAVALLVIKECFNPMIDPRTNIDMTTHALYNRRCEFDRLNYTGFYTAILEKEDEMISVATIRVHGVRLAEMPLIGTREKYRRQGMCRLLVGIIEKLLVTLHVASFVIPAIPELFETWTQAFGFKPLHSSLKSTLKDTSMMVFPGTELLYKSICASPMQNTKLC